jgi:hypothetical protein
MTKILAILKASWIIGQAAGWLLFGCLAVSVSPAGEPFRVEPRPLAVPLPDERCRPVLSATLWPYSWCYPL